MRKVIASLNITLDSYCDHDIGIVNDELHENVNELFRRADLCIIGRVTYQLMESAWPAIVEHPTGNKPMDEFAVLMDNIPKLVFSNTLKSVEWKTATLAKRNLEDEVRKQRQRDGKDIVVGGPSVIEELMNAGLIDEFQFYLHPIVAGKGKRPFFKNIHERIDLKLVKTKTLSTRVIILYYEKK